MSTEISYEIRLFAEIPDGTKFCFFDPAPAYPQIIIWVKVNSYKAEPKGYPHYGAFYVAPETKVRRAHMAKKVAAGTKKDSMTVYLNKTPIDLPQKNFLAAGGQGSVFVKGSTAYKIYTDSKTAIPRGKLKELSYLTNHHIIRPLDILEDNQGNYVGYTMQYIKDTVPLCQIVPKSYKDRNGIKPEMTLELIRQLQEIMEFTHSKNMLMVDINDLNYLVSSKFSDLYAIDVDSFATPSYPATAIMDSIRDRHNKSFNKGTDYFSFAVTSFSTLIGIHPYRGSHSKYEKYPLKERLEKRMRDNVSVFHKDVSIPGACLSLDIIPPALRDWFEHIFETKDREPPPGIYKPAAVKAVRIRNVKHQDLKISLIKRLDQSNIITRLYYMCGRLFEICDPHQFMTITKNGKAINLLEGSDGVEWGSIEGNDRGNFVGVTRLFNVDNNIYGIVGNKLVRLEFIDLPGQIMGGMKQIGSLVGMDTGKDIYQNCIIQNVLGRQTVVLPRDSQINYVPLPELDGMVIADAKYMNNVLIVTALDRKTQECHRHVFRFTPDMKYDLRVVKDVDPGAGVVFTVSQKGIVIMRNEDNKFEIFHNDPKQNNIKMVPLAAVEIDSIWSIAGDILFTQGNEIHKISL